MEYGLIGEHLQHSFSAEIHRRIGRYDYELVELAPSELDVFLKKRDFRGLNVTIPYKQAVIPYLDSLSPEAKKIGAVNTIVNRDRKLTGYNTDYYGFAVQAGHCGIDFKGKKILLLGRGGAAKAVSAVVMDAGAAKLICTGQDTDCSATALGRDYDVIINATPVGMFPDSDAPLLVHLQEFPKLEAVLDCVYNPLRTNLVSNAQLRGITAEGGLYMLVAQAVKASEFFLGENFPQGMTEQIYNDILSEKQNTVIIGMPSCGKTTLGRKLALESGRKFVDTDEMIVERAGKSIPEIFQTEGEQGFREKETRVVREVSQMQGCVIATGGGAVLDEDNMLNLRHNGRIIYLQAELDVLQTGGDRPLSKDKQTIKRMYAERHPLYLKYADTIECRKSCQK